MLSGVKGFVNRSGRAANPTGVTTTSTSILRPTVFPAANSEMICLPTERRTENGPSSRKPPGWTFRGRWGKEGVTRLSSETRQSSLRKTRLR